MRWLRRLLGAEALEDEARELREMLRSTLKANEATIRAQQKTLDRMVQSRFDPLEVKPMTEQPTNPVFPQFALSDTLGIPDDKEFLEAVQ